MNPEDFESELQRHPIRSVPETWRKEILAAAHARNPRRNWLEAFRISIGNLFAPNRPRWCAVGAAWALILFLQFSATEPSSMPLSPGNPEWFPGEGR